MNKTVTIQHQTYNVISRRTADDMEASGLQSTAQHMRQHGHIADYLLQKKMGGIVYNAIQHQSGNFSKVIRLG